jgi:hypothetical protein
MLNVHVILAEQILPTDSQLLALAGFVLLILACLVGFGVGLKLQLGARKRLGIWMAWVSLSLAAGLITFLATR